MTLLNLSGLEWVPGRLKRNQAIFQHLMDSTDRITNGVFVNPPKLAGDDLRKYVGPSPYKCIHTRTPGGKSVSIVDSAFTIWDWHLGPITNIWAARLRTTLQRTLLTGSPYMLWLNAAGRLETALAFHLRKNATSVVFDWSDDFHHGFNVRATDLKRLTAMADHVLCVNDTVASAIEHRNLRVFGNCTDPASFQTWDPGFTLRPWWPKLSQSTYIGFIGNFNDLRIDTALLETLFKRFPRYQFLFVGVIHSSALLNWLTSFPNAAFVTAVPYADLTHIIHSFDVAIIPHLDNSHTRGNDLLKVLDYFACEVPVVSTLCSGVERYGDALWLAPTQEAFGDHIEGLLSGRLRHDGGLGSQIANTRSWNRQVKELTPWLFS